MLIWHVSFLGLRDTTRISGRQFIFSSIVQGKYLLFTCLNHRMAVH